MRTEIIEQMFWDQWVMLILYIASFVFLFFFFKALNRKGKTSKKNLFFFLGFFLVASSLNVIVPFEGERAPLCYIIEGFVKNESPQILLDKDLSSL